MSAWNAQFNGVNVISRNLPERTLGVVGAAAAVHRDIPFRGLAVANQVNAYPGAAASFILGYPAYGDGFEYHVELALGADQNATGKSVIVARVAGAEANVDLDASVAYLAAIPGVSAETVAPATTNVTWLVAAGQSVDAALVSVHVRSMTGTFRWVVMARPDAGSVSLPTLPLELSSWTPTRIEGTDVILVDDDRITDFDAARLGVGVAILDRPMQGPTARVRYVIEHVAP